MSSPAAATVSTGVVVIGAGLSGLGAATELRRRGVDALVLEARDRVGGRTLNHPLGDGQVVELGGQWVGPGQDQVLATARELKVETFPTRDGGRKVLRLAGRRATYGGFVPPLPLGAKLDFGLALVRLDRMARHVSPAEPWKARRAAEWDGQTLGGWAERTMRTEAARSSLRIWSRSVLAAELEELSLLHALAHAAAHRGVFALASTRGGAQQDRIVGGSQRISELLAEPLGERLLLERPVHRIEHDDDGVVVHAEGLVVKAARAIVATSPAIAGRIDYEPRLPADRERLAERMVMGTITKVIAVYPEPFWREEGLSGQGVADEGLLTAVFDNSPPGGEPGVLVGFVAGTNARAFSALEPDTRREEALRCFAAWFGDRALEVSGYAEKAWNEDRWAGGGYFGYFAPGGWTDLGPILTTPVGRIHWAGSETSGVCMGSMDGALRAGIRAAAETAEDGAVRPGAAEAAGAPS